MDETYFADTKQTEVVTTTEVRTTTATTTAVVFNTKESGRYRALREGGALDSAVAAEVEALQATTDLEERAARRKERELALREAVKHHRHESAVHQRHESLRQGHPSVSR